MRFRPIVLTALVMAAYAAAPALAHAQASTARGKIRGVAHDFAVPSGWTTRASDAGMEFLPPSGRVKRLTVAIVGVETTAGTDARTVMNKLVDDEKKRKKHYREATAPEPIDFAGAPGSLVILSGTSTSGDLEGEMLVVSVASSTVYLFTCEGLIADMNATVEDLAAIIGGVRAAGAGLGGSAGGSSPGSGGDLGDLLRDGPGGGAGFGTKNGAVPVIDLLLADGAFGVQVKPLRFWKLSIADDEYQLERTNESPAAVVAIRRVPVANARSYARTAQAGGRSKSTRFAGAEALLVERKTGDTIERTYHIVRGKYALVFEFRVVGRGGESGADARVFEIEQALVLDDKGVDRWSDGATELTTYGGVGLTTTPGWKLAAVGPGRANFRSDRGVEVEVRVRPWPASKDPFVTAEEAVKARCGKAPYTRADAAVLGAAQAVRYRCASKKAAQVVLVASGTGAGGERVYVQVTATNPKKKGQPADAEIAEFGAYVALPR